MADVTLSSRTLIQPYRSRAGSPRIITPPVASTRASTAAITNGVVVQFDLTSTSHFKIIRCSTAVATALQSTTLCGIAAQSESSVGTDEKISVWAADANTEFLFPTKIAGTASSLVGTPLSLCWDSTLNIHYAQASSSAGTEAIWCTDVINPGDTNGYIVGRFFSTRVSPAVWTR